MEELRSTEVLDKEIREDSRKKAEKILAKAEESARQLVEGVSERVEKAAQELDASTKAKLELYKKNVNASLPLEKQRFLVSYIYGSVVDAMNEYFEGIGEGKCLDVIQNLVDRSKEKFAGKKVDATVIGFDLKNAEKMLKNSLGKDLGECKKGEEILLSDEAVKGFNKRQGMILKAQDGSVTCRLTLDEKIKEILDVKCCELATALFDGRLPE